MEAIRTYRKNMKFSLQGGFLKEMSKLRPEEKEASQMERRNDEGKSTDGKTFWNLLFLSYLISLGEGWQAK